MMGIATLTESALINAACMCSDLDAYRVLLCCGKRAWDNALLLLKDIIHKESIRSISSHIISFNNGSSIRHVPMSESARGYRAHYIIAEDNIDTKVLNDVLRPSIMQYWK